nr:aquaporin [Mycoplasmopsis bovis]
MLALGSALVDLLYWKHVKETSLNEPEEFKSKFLAMHATGPSNRNIIFNFLMEIVGTLVLLIAIVAVGRFVTIPFVVPIVVGLVVAVIGMSLGGTTGYAINPAQRLIT